MNRKNGAILLVGLLAASAATAAPKIDHVAVKPNSASFSGGKPPEVEISVSISRSQFDRGCDARVEFGDGEGRNIEFGVATIRTVRHAYRTGGSFTVIAKGTGKTPCEGLQQAALTVAGAPEPAKTPEAKKAEPEKEVKGPEPKKQAKKAPAKKKPVAKKKDTTKAEPK